MMKLLIIILLFVLAACVVDNAAYEYRIQGKELARTGNYEEAILSFNKALELNPEYDTAMLNIGSCHWKFENYDKAEEYFNKTLAINSKYDKAYLYLGILLDSPEAKIRNFTKGLDYARDDSLKSEFHTLIAKVYLDQKKYRIALVHYNSALSILPNRVDNIRTVATIHSRLGEFKIANRLHKKAIELGSNDSDNYNDYGASLQRQRKLNDAIIMYKKAIANSPEDYQFSYNLASAYFTQRDYTSAQSEINRSLTLAPEELHCLLLKGKILLKLGITDEACDIVLAICQRSTEEGIDLSKFDDAQSITFAHKDVLKRMETIEEAIEAMKGGLYPIELMFYEAYLLHKNRCTN